MKLVKWLLLFVVWTGIAAVFHYSLPRNDVVRIVETEVQRMDVGEWPMFWADPSPGTQALGNRDVPFIRAVEDDGGARVYRNEDTGWGWPPYFKFDTADLQTNAANYASTQGTPRWVAVRYYGWRVPYLTIFPNALSVREVEGPAATVIPWTAIVVLILFFAVFWAVYTRWRRFAREHVDPWFDDRRAAADERRREREERRSLRRQGREG